MNDERSERHSDGRVLALAAALAATLAAAQPAAAQALRPEDALRLGGASGLGGFQGMVDARTPRGWHARVGLSYRAARHERDFRGAVALEHRDELHGGGLVGRLAGPGPFGSAFEIGATLGLYQHHRRERDFLGRRDTGGSNGSSGSGRGEILDPDEHAEGWGDTELALKLTLPWDTRVLQLAPYASFRAPTGERLDHEGPAAAEYGLAATISPSDQEVLSIHLNLGGYHEEEGVSALRWRAGAAATFLPSRELLLRLYVYGSGVQHEGRDDGSLDLELGLQVLGDLGPVLVSLDLGLSVRVVEVDARRPALRDELDRQRIHERHADEGREALYGAITFSF